jgi:hypothetical protein
MAPFRQSYPLAAHRSHDRSAAAAAGDGDQCRRLLEESHTAVRSNTVQLIQKQRAVLTVLPNPGPTLVELEQLERAASNGRDEKGNSITPTRALSMATSFIDKTLDTVHNHSTDALKERDQEIVGLMGAVKDLEMENRYLLECSKSVPGQPSVQEALLHARRAEDERLRYKKELDQCHETMISNTLELIQKEKKLLEPMPSNLTSIELDNLERRTRENEIPVTAALTTATSYLDYIVKKFHSSHDLAMKRMCDEARVLHEKVEALESQTSSPTRRAKGDDIFKALELVEECLTSIEARHPRIFDQVTKEGGQYSVVSRLNAIRSYMETLQASGTRSPTFAQREAASIKSRIAVFDQRFDDNGRARNLEAKLASLERTNEQLRARLHELEAQCESDRAALLTSKQEAGCREADVRKLQEQCETLRKQLSVIDAERKNDLQSAVARLEDERSALEAEILSLTGQLKAEKSMAAIQKAALEDAKLIVEEQSITRAKLAERIDTLEDEVSRSRAKGAEDEPEGTAGTDKAKAEAVTDQAEAVKEEAELAANAWRAERDQMTADHERRVRNLKTLVEEVEAQRDRLRAERDELRMSRSGRHWVDQVQELEAERDRLVGNMRMSLEEIEAERDELRQELYRLRTGQTGNVHPVPRQNSPVERTVAEKFADLVPSFSSSSSDGPSPESDGGGVDDRQMQMLHEKIAERAVTQAGLIARLQEENEIKDVKLQNLQSTIDRLMEEREEQGGRFSVWRKTLVSKAKRDSRVQRADGDVAVEDEEREGR